MPIDHDAPGSSDDRIFRLMDSPDGFDPYDPGAGEARAYDGRAYDGRAYDAAPAPRLRVAARPAWAAVVLAAVVAGVCAWLAFAPGTDSDAVAPRSAAAIPAAGQSLSSGSGLSSAAAPDASNGAAAGAWGAAGATASGGSAGPGGSAAGSAAGAAISVYVVGQVRTPGVVSLPSGSRVVDAIAAAGGATDKADLTVVNLARKVDDGEQIFIPKPGQAIPSAAGGSAGSAAGGSTSSGGSAGSSGSTAPVNLNTATLEQLDSLPGVGPVLAGRIVQYRQQNGQFASVDQLGQVSGIGDATLAKLRPLVTV